MRGLATLLVMLAAPSLAVAQEQPPPEEERPVYFGLSGGFFGMSLHVGIRDVVARDADLRIASFFGAHFGADGAFGGGGHVQLLWAPGEHSLRGYLGGGLEVSYLEEFCIFGCHTAWSGGYGGGIVTAGFEAGWSEVRFFLEGGVSVVGPLSTTNDAPSVLLRPRAELGFTFL